MYITTFYSFKGGVGRTMALVNAAVALALRGRRVLVVDFDIEAPGLDTFDVLRPAEEIPGIVDFVSQYLETGITPNATNFIGECPQIGEQEGRIWIMPSGKNETYSAHFNQVVWSELYDRHDGFLLFEDLKKQWNLLLDPDYILIDSRTGHTDTCGICTRQLPDSVVVFFFPNEQNLRGLTEVVSDIRSEADGPRNKNIALHFVMSNVPDLDDEDRILEGKIAAFQDQLRFHRDPMVVHRYDSLSLLNQVVFSKDRPRSRLASEYGAIVREISARNWRDRDGALEYIRRARRRWQWIQDDSTQTREQMLEKIAEGHTRDGELLYRLAELRETDRQMESAALLVNQAIEAGYDKADAYLKRSKIRADNGDVFGATDDARRVLASEQVAPPMAREAIARLTQLEDGVYHEVVKSVAVKSLDLDDKFWLANTFKSSLADVSIAVSLWQQILETSDLQENMSDQAKYALGLSYMGVGKCSDASRMFRQNNQDLSELDISNLFNYGMATWGEKKAIVRDVFQRVVEHDRSGDETDKDLNYLQCMTIAYWAIDDYPTAIEYAERAQRTLGFYRGRTEFSCWQYLQVSAAEFETDLNEIREMISGNGPEFPKFIRRNDGEPTAL